MNVTVSSPIDYTALLELAADIVNECQVGDITASLNISGACNSVTVPSSDPSDEAIVYNTPSPDHLVMTVEPMAEYEGVPLRRQPKIQAVDLSVSISCNEVIPLTLYPIIMPFDAFENHVYENIMENGALALLEQMLHFL